MSPSNNETSPVLGPPELHDLLVGDELEVHPAEIRTVRGEPAAGLAADPGRHAAERGMLARIHEGRVDRLRARPDRDRLADRLGHRSPPCVYLVHRGPGRLPST